MIYIPDTSASAELLGKRELLIMHGAPAMRPDAFRDDLKERTAARRWMRKEGDEGATRVA